MPRPPGDTNDLLVCADVLGAFGVTAADIRRAGGHSTGNGDSNASKDRQGRAAHGDDRDLEDALADVLSTGRDRRAVLRRTIAQSDRGISCSARYARETLERELRGVFESIGWAFELERFDTPTPAARRELKLRASDYHNRTRETTFEYPDTPLGTDNLPAVLWAINDVLLSGTDARFVVLSDGVDRWQAAMIDATELERLRERYGRRVAVGERSLLPAHGLAAYVPDELLAEPAPVDDPWPAWAHTRDGAAGSTSGVEPLIEEAESDTARSGAADDEPLIEEAEAETKSEAEPAPTEQPPSSASTETDTSTDGDGLEFHGSPSVSRVADTDSNAGSDANAAPTAERNRTSDAGSAAEAREHESNTSESSFGELSGTSTTTRVSNDSFGSDVEWESDDDRYRALGAALGAGGRITVAGLLEDGDFLPELPAAEPEETRIAFQDPFDPGALQEAKAAAEESGFVWVDSGSLETTRISNG